MPFKAELHCHSFHSHGTKIFYDGIHSPKQMVKQAGNSGLEAVALTDHNSIEGWGAAKATAKNLNMVFIPGEEVSSLDGHILVLGLNEFISPQLSAEETLDLIREQDAVAIAPHPFDIKGDGIGKKSLQCGLIESFNPLNLDRLSNWNAKRFAKKHSLIESVGSDAHSMEMLGYNFTEFNCEKSLDSILLALKKGEFKVTKNYIPFNVTQKWAIEKLKLSYPQTKEYINSYYSFPKKIVSRVMLELVRKSPGDVDYLLKTLAYFGLVNAFAYSSLRQFKHWV